jgi:menaquinone-9 beta-reductase
LPTLPPASGLEAFVINATITCEEAVSVVWDAIIIGAGPSGAFLAYQLAAHSHKILLLDKAHFPRTKVCGSCINISAAQALKQNGLGNLLSENHAVALEKVKLFDGKKSSAVSLSGGYSLSRNAFDSALVEAGIGRGAHFIPGATARVQKDVAELQEVKVEIGTFETTLKTKIVVVADGLSGRALAGIAEFDFVSEPASRIGCGTIIDSDEKFYVEGKIYMACSDHGYVGLVRLENGQIDVAAALTSKFTRAQGGPGPACTSILQHCQLPVPDGLNTSHWAGTEALTRRRHRIAGKRLFVIGDACGFSEPLTGEGIAWALWSASAAKDLVIDAISQWHPGLIDSWHTTHFETVGRRHLISKLVALTMRKKTLRRIAMPLLMAFPSIATPLIKCVSGAAKLPGKNPKHKPHVFPSCAR